MELHINIFSKSDNYLGRDGFTVYTLFQGYCYLLTSKHEKATEFFPYKFPLKILKGHDDNKFILTEDHRMSTKELSLPAKLFESLEFLYSTDDSSISISLICYEYQENLDHRFNDSEAVYKITGNIKSLKKDNSQSFFFDGLTSINANDNVGLKLCLKMVNFISKTIESDRCYYDKSDSFKKDHDLIDLIAERSILPIIGDQSNGDYDPVLTQEFYSLVSAIMLENFAIFYTKRGLNFLDAELLHEGLDSYDFPPRGLRTVFYLVDLFIKTTNYRLRPIVSEEKLKFNMSKFLEIRELGEESFNIRNYTHTSDLFLNCSPTATFLITFLYLFYDQSSPEAKARNTETNTLLLSLLNNGGNIKLSHMICKNAVANSSPTLKIFLDKRDSLISKYRLVSFFSLTEHISEAIEVATRELKT